MGHGADEHKAIAQESRRVRSALDDLADLAGGSRRRAPPRPVQTTTPIPGLLPEIFPLPPQAIAPPVEPAHAPSPQDDWFGEDEAAAFTGPPSGEVDFNSTADVAEDTLGIRSEGNQNTPAGGLPMPEPTGPVSEAINDVLDGFEW